MNYKNIPNILTILRILLVLPCATLFYYEQYIVSVVIFMLASVTDCIDGYLARKLACQSKLGAILDPIADKLLIIALFIVLTLKQFIPMWFASIMIIRELILLSGAFFYRVIFGPVIFHPTILSKINTILILFLLFLKLVEAISVVYTIPLISNFIVTNKDLYIQYIEYLIYLILFTSLYTAVDYCIKWVKRVVKSIYIK